MQSFRQQIPRAARAFSTTTPRSLAKMQLIGRLAATPEVTPTSTGREIIKYAIGVSSGPRNEDGNRGVSWFRIASFAEGGQRDYLTSLSKGALLFVEAEARMDTYKAEDGSNRTSLNLVARNFEVLSRPRREEGEDGESSSA